MGIGFDRPWVLILLLPALALALAGSGLRLVVPGWLRPLRRLAVPGWLHRLWRLPVRRRWRLPFAIPGLTPRPAGLRRPRGAAAGTTWYVPPRPAPQRRLAAALRALMLALVILALAGTNWHLTAGRQATVFVVDVSASAASARPQAEGFIRSALPARGHEDQAAVVAVGETALVEVPLGTATPSGPIASTPGPHFTNLAEGLRLAGALLPEGVRRRIVLLSDGHANGGDAVAEARSLGARGVRIDVVALEAGRGTEVLVEEVRAPARSIEGDEVPVTATVHATQAVRATLRLFAGRTPVAEQEVDLRPGANQVSFRTAVDTQGFQTYRVTVEAQGDTIGENNQGAAVTRVVGAPTVLVVQGEADDGAALAGALGALGIRVQLRPAEAVPEDLDGLRGYAAVVLAGVPAHHLREQTMANLEAYVRELGGGLMMVGGELSYGLGGYFGTPVERALPVYTDLKGRGEVPSLGLVLVIDKSGSMGFVPRFGGPIKMELAKEAAMRAVEMLSERDLLGVVAFDSSAGWVVDLQPVEQRAGLVSRIGRIYPGGGTNIFPGVEMAFEALRGTLVKAKHVILLTDGVSAYGGDYQELTRKMREFGITLSAVAVGSDSDITLLQSLSRWGGGRYYFTADGEDIPTIFAKETVMATRNYVVEKVFTPAAGSASPLIKGLTRVPPLAGYVATRPKEAAEVALISPDQDPVLAHWQYGLGRAVAWTPDLKGRWGRAWLGTGALQQLLGNIVAWLLPPEEQGDLLVATGLAAGTGTVSVEVGGGADTAVAPTRARIIAPDQTTQEIELQAVAPGQYEGRFPAREPGAYLVQVDQPSPDGGAVTRTGAGLVVPYSPEFARAGVNYRLLGQVASAAGGEFLRDPRQAFASNLPPVSGSVDLWPWLLALAALLWPLDIAVRRLVLRGAEVRAWLAARLAWLARRRGGAVAVGAAAVTRQRLRARLAGHRDAHAAVADQWGAAAVSAGAGAGAQPAAGAEPAAGALRDAAAAADEPPATAAAAVGAVVVARRHGEAQDLASRLLEAKRRRRSSA